MKCKVCASEAAVSLKSHNAAFCKTCFLEFFRRQVIRGIKSQNLLKPQDKTLVAISGGKDSLALLLELKQLGYDVTGLFIDLAISGFSEIAHSKVEAFCKLHDIPLKIIELEKEGLAISDVKENVNRPVCSVCGKIKRYYFNKAALEDGYDILATGHNLDDEAARLMSNVLRWDQDYLTAQGPYLAEASGFAAKIKPLWRLTEFETANYAFIQGIDYHCAVCPYSPGASFSTIKNWLNRLERIMPGRKLDFYQGFLVRGKVGFASAMSACRAPLRPCEKCGYPTSGENICGVCGIKRAMKNRINK